MASLRCAICFTFATVDGLSALSCGHTFHVYCIRKWLKNRMHCPVCRKVLERFDVVKQLLFDLRPKKKFQWRTGERTSKNKLDESKVSDKEDEMQDVMTCTLCTKRLHFNDTAALRCGHTFHFPCISTRVEIDRSCPICDEESGGNSIIPHLFFEIDENEKNQTVVNYSGRLQSWLCFIVKAFTNPKWLKVRDRTKSRISYVLPGKPNTRKFGRFFSSLL